MYAYADRLLGRVMAAMDRKTTLLVLSDHGFELGKLQDDPSKTRDMRRVSEAFHRTEGILYLYGNRVKPRVRLNRPTILDIAPTVLALNGLGRASDMPGRVLAKPWISRFPRRSRATSRPERCGRRGLGRIDGPLFRLAGRSGDRQEAAEPGLYRREVGNGRPEPRRRSPSRPAASKRRAREYARSSPRSPTTARSARATPARSARSASTTPPTWS